MAEQFKVGDVVKLKSKYGPDMVIEGMAGSDVAECIWFETQNWEKPRKYEFKVATLKPAKVEK